MSTERCEPMTQNTGPRRATDMQRDASRQQQCAQQQSAQQQSAQQEAFGAASVPVELLGEGLWAGGTAGCLSSNSCRATALIPASATPRQSH